MPSATGPPVAADSDVELDAVADLQVFPAHVTELRAMEEQTAFVRFDEVESTELPTDVIRLKQRGS